jgi:hypothetical protein
LTKARNLALDSFDNFITEPVVITGSAPIVNHNILNGSVFYYTGNATANFTLNFRVDNSTTLNSLLAVGQSSTSVVMVTNGATAYYPNVIQIDGTTVTPKWSGGTAPTSGNSNAIDVYTFTIIKTANATYTALASQVKFA